MQLLRMPQFIIILGRKTSCNISSKKKKPIGIYTKNISGIEKTFKGVQLQEIRMPEEILRVLSSKNAMHIDLQMHRMQKLFGLKRRLHTTGNCKKIKTHGLNLTVNRLKSLIMINLFMPTIVCTFVANN